MAHRGRNGSACWLSGHAGLATTLLRCLPEDPMVATVEHSPDRRFTAVLDGRIDNRTDLESVVRGDVHGESDVAVALALFRRGGRAAFADLVGDFAIAIWDEREQQLTVAVDPMAGRSLYSCRVGHRVAVASEVRVLLALDWVPRALDLGRIAEVLTGDPRSLDDTVYSAVKRLPPGCDLVERLDGGVSRRTFWSVTPGADRRPIDEITEDLRGRMEEAVRCRLRAVGPVASELSGGLDSSTVTSLAAQLARSEGRGRVTALTNAYESGAADERHYAETAAQHARVQLEVLHHAGGVLDAAADARFALDLPAPADAEDTIQLARRAVEMGATVVLTGQGGDQVFSAAAGAALDQLAHGQLTHVVAAIRANAWGRRPLSFARGIYWALARPLAEWLLPGTERRRIGRETYPWLTAELLAESGLRDRLLQGERAERFRRPTDRQRIDAISSGNVVAQWDVMGRVYGSVPIDARHPFMDRRVVELAVAIPARYTSRGDDWRAIHRRVTPGILPESIRTRMDKAEFSQLATRSLEQLGGETFFAGCHPVRMGWVDRDEILRCHRLFRSADSLPPFGPALLAVAGVHHLLDAVSPG